MATAKKNNAKPAEDTYVDATRELINKAFYAIVGIAEVQTEEVEKAIDYLARKGKPRGRRLERVAEDTARDARRRIEDLKETARDFAERFGVVIEDIRHIAA